MENKEHHIENQQHCEAVETPERIFSLLKPTIGDETLLKILPEHSDEVFQTSLLNIDYERKLLTIKKIDYTFGHFMVIDAKSLTIYSQHNGAEVSFSAYLSRYSERNGGFYEIRFPERVKFCQQTISH